MHTTHTHTHTHTDTHTHTHTNTHTHIHEHAHTHTHIHIHTHHAFQALLNFNTPVTEPLYVSADWVKTSPETVELVLKKLQVFKVRAGLHSAVRLTSTHKQEHVRFFGAEAPCFCVCTHCTFTKCLAYFTNNASRSG